MNNETLVKSYITFGLADDKFALSVTHVQEIVELERVTRVPNAPAYMLGIINLRGRVLPLVDTRQKLGLPKTETTKKSRILVLDVQLTDDKTVQIGALVDVAREVVELSPTDIQDAPEYENYSANSPIAGVVNNHGDITMIMDINRVFSAADLLQLNEAMN